MDESWRRASGRLVKALIEKAVNDLPAIGSTQLLGTGIVNPINMATDPLHNCSYPKSAYTQPNKHDHGSKYSLRFG